MRYTFFLFVAISLASCGARAGSSAAAADSSVQQQSAVVQYTYNVLRVLPHDPASYTQGLYWDSGYFMEGTGEWGASALKRVEPQSGKVLVSKPIGREFFGEGIARLGERIYQLTWTDGRAFVYDAATLEPVGSFNYTGEGWGLATDGQKLYMSDGTHRIREVDPNDFSRGRTIEVTMDGSRINMLNEMEWIEGELWANVYMSDVIVRIDPQTGNVTGVVDLTGLLPEADRTPETDVLNGIAYDSDTKKIYVTGKKWSKLFEIELIEKR